MEEENRDENKKSKVVYEDSDESTEDKVHNLFDDVDEEKHPDIVVFGSNLMPNPFYYLIPGTNQTRIHKIFIRRLPALTKQTFFSLHDPYTLKLRYNFPIIPVELFDKHLNDLPYLEKTKNEWAIKYSF